MRRVELVKKSLLISTFCIGLLLGPSLIVLGQEELSPRKQRALEKREGFPHNKNNSSELSFAYGLSFSDLTALNDRLSGSDAGRLSQWGVRFGFNYLLTIREGWAFTADYTLDANRNRRNANFDTRLTHQQLKLMGGKDVLPVANRRLIFMGGLGLAGSTFSTLLRKPESIDFDDLVNATGPRNAGQVNALSLTGDIRVQYDRLNSWKEGKYGKISYFAGYEIALAKSFKNGVNNVPDFAPRGLYLGYMIDIAQYKVRN